MLAPIDWPNSALAMRVGIDEMRFVVAGIGDDGALEPLGRQREVGVAGEFAGQEFGGVDDHPGGAVLDRGQHLAGAGDDDVAAEHEIGAAGRDADGVDVRPASRRCGCG